MFITLDNSKHVDSWSFGKNNDTMIEIDNSLMPTDWNQNAFYYKYEDGKLIFDANYKEQLDGSAKILRLRKDRELKCFPIINRGYLWYKTLSNKQIKELENWYAAWLDAPQTLTEPHTPEWLK